MPSQRCEVGFLNKAAPKNKGKLGKFLKLVLEFKVNHPHVFLNHSCRKLEDKLQAVRIALRPFTLNLNVDELHKNRESPSAFMCYLGVIDSSLPVKGTAHRKVRGAPESESSVNELPVFMLMSLSFASFPPT